MRVAFVLGTTSGGTGRHVRMLVEGLVARGHQVLVIGPRSVEEAFAFSGAGARFVEVPISDRPHPVNDVRAIAAIRRLTREAEVVHAHGLRAGALAALARMGMRSSAGARGPDSPAGAPGGSSGAGRGMLVVTLHNALTAGGVIGAVYATLERIVARRADVVLAVSPDLGERMRALGARAVAEAVVPAPDLRPASRTPAQVREGLGAGERPIVLTIGRLAQQKGLEMLLDVAAGPWGHTGERAAGVGGPGSGQGEESVPLFVVAGEGPLRGELQARIDAEALPVVLLGNREDLPDLLAAATAVLWASRWEGQPLSLSETLKAGKPVIATDVGGVPALLGGAGVLVPYGDVAAMRSAVQRLVEDPVAAGELARAAARRGADLPSDDDAVEAALKIYRLRNVRAGGDD